MNTPVMGRWGCTHQSWGGGSEHTSHGEVGVNTPVMSKRVVVVLWPYYKEHHHGGKNSHSKKRGLQRVKTRLF